jgi:hypothetical protein
LVAGTFTGGVSEASFEYEYHFIEYEYHFIEYEYHFIEYEYHFIEYKYQYERAFLATITCGEPILVAVCGATNGEQRIS